MPQEKILTLGFFKPTVCCSTDEIFKLVGANRLDMLKNKRVYVKAHINDVNDQGENLLPFSLKHFSFDVSVFLLDMGANQFQEARTILSLAERQIGSDVFDGSMITPENMLKKFQDLREKINEKERQYNTMSNLPSGTDSELSFTSYEESLSMHSAPP